MSGAAVSSTVGSNQEQRAEASRTRAEVDAEIEQKHRAGVDVANGQVDVARTAIADAQAATRAARDAEEQLEAEIAALDRSIAQLEAERLAAKHDRDAYRIVYAKLLDANSERERLGLVLEDARRKREHAKSNAQAAQVALKSAEVDRHQHDVFLTTRKLLRSGAAYIAALNTLDREFQAHLALLREVDRAEGRQARGNDQETVVKGILRALLKTRAAFETMEGELSYYPRTSSDWVEELRLAQRELESELNPEAEPSATASA